eukprot:evm.model.NODE_38741_length_30766_cov_32.428623.1
MLLVKVLVQQSMVHQSVSPVKKRVIYGQGEDPVLQDSRPRRQRRKDLHSHVFKGIKQDEQERQATKGRPDAHFFQTLLDKRIVRHGGSFLNAVAEKPVLCPAQVVEARDEQIPKLAHEVHAQLKGWG